MKRKDRQHLPKVGSKPQRRYSQQHQRDAVADNYGLEVEKHTTAEKVGAGVVGGDHRVRRHRDPVLHVRDPFTRRSVRRLPCCVSGSNPPVSTARCHT